MTGSDLASFYDSHPINEDEILAKLREKGKDLDALNVADLAEFDHDNYGGPKGGEILAERAGISSGDHVLDICSGMGGPSRWLAHHLGCRITGIDLTLSRVESARRLTDKVSMSDRIEFVHGDATDMPFDTGRFDAAISQEAFLHIPDKNKLIPEVVRVIKPGGVLAFTEIIAREPLNTDDAARLAEDFQSPGIGPVDRYFKLLGDAGCEVVQHEDMSDVWTDVLVKRLDMYRSLRDTTVAKFGEPHYNDFDDVYAFFVGLFTAGKLGGARITAKKSA